MLGLILFIFSATTLSAVNFTAPDKIDDFSILGNRTYVNTPSKTYLLNSSLSITAEFNKSLQESRLFYANTEFLLECGINKTAADDCCFLRDPVTLAYIHSLSSNELCNQFSPTRYQYPCYSPKATGVGHNFYLLVSFYKSSQSPGGSFTRLWFPNISESVENPLNQLTPVDITNFNKIVEFRPKVLSPQFSEFEKYVVIRKSTNTKEAHYFNPNIALTDGNPVALLTCGTAATDVHSAFAVQGTDQMKIGSNLTAGKRTHFVLFNDQSTSIQPKTYRICSYTEDVEMLKEGNKLANIRKDKSFEITLGVGKEIEAFNGRLVNKELVALYSVGSDVFKVG